MKRDLKQETKDAFHDIGGKSLFQKVKRALNHSIFNQRRMSVKVIKLYYLLEHDDQDFDQLTLCLKFINEFTPKYSDCDTDEA